MVCSEVAQAAGISHGTIFLYFPSKDALFRAAVLEPLEAFATQSLEMMDGEGGALQRIRRLVREQVMGGAAEQSYLQMVQLAIAQGEQFGDLPGRGAGRAAACTDLVHGAAARPLGWIFGFSDDAELVALGIGHDVPVKAVLAHLTAQLPGAQRQESVALLIQPVHMQIEVHAVLTHLWLRDTLQQELGPARLGRREHQVGVLVW